jgi:hypothetical protein
MKQKGAQAVEFALVLPFFILILFAVLDFGMLVYNKAIITNASREGARSGVLFTPPPWSNAAAIDAACNYARSALIGVNRGTTSAKCDSTGNPAVTVFVGGTAPCPSPSSSGSKTPEFGDLIAVTIKYSFSGFLLGSGWFGTGTSASSTFELTACTQMRHE